MHVLQKRHTDDRGHAPRKVERLLAGPEFDFVQRVFTVEQEGYPLDLAYALLRRLSACAEAQKYRQQRQKSDGAVDKATRRRREKGYEPHEYRVCYDRRSRGLPARRTG